MSKPTVTGSQDKNLKKEIPGSKGSETTMKAGQKLPAQGAGTTANTKLGGTNTTTKTGR